MPTPAIGGLGCHATPSTALCELIYCLATSTVLPVLEQWEAMGRGLHFFVVWLGGPKFAESW